MVTIIQVCLFRLQFFSGRCRLTISANSYNIINIWIWIFKHKLLIHFTLILLWYGDLRLLFAKIIIIMSWLVF